MCASMAIIVDDIQDLDGVSTLSWAVKWVNTCDIVPTSLQVLFFSRFNVVTPPTPLLPLLKVILM